MGWFEDTVDRAKNIGMGSFVSGNTLTGALGTQFGNVDLQGNPIAGAQPPAAAMPNYANPRQADMDAGYAKGKEIFYDDPDMKDLRERRMDLSKGYNGQELGAMREQARNEMQGKRAGYMQQLAARQAKSGMGGARAAAAQAAADRGFQQNAGEMERKMTLDNANQVREGTKDLQDFLMRQKYGMLGTGIGYGQMGVADRTAGAQMAAANRPEKKGFLSNVFDSLL